MSNDGVSSDIELNSAELEDSNSNSKFKCNLSSDSATLIMGLNSEYCNNGTGSGNLGLGLLQNFDESNLFQCDVYEWIGPRTESGSSVDLDSSKIESLDLCEKIVTLSELTSPKSDNADIDKEVRIDSVFSMPSNLTSQSQTEYINTTFLDELNGFQADPTSKEEALINENLFLHFSPSKSTTKDDSSHVESLEPFGLLRDLNNDDNSNNNKHEVRLPKTKNALPFIKIPKKLIRSGKILKKENFKSLNILNALEQTNSNKDLHEKDSFVPIDDVINDGSSENLQLFSTAELDNSEILMFPVSNENITFVNEAMTSVNDDSQISTLVNSDLTSNESEEKSPKAVVAISTNKLEDITEIIIKTEIGEEQYIGKASDILKATNSLSNFCLKLESQAPLSKDEGLSQSELPGILVELNPVQDEEARKNHLSSDEPITEALRKLGIVPNDQWDCYELKDGNRHTWICPLADCNDVFNKLSGLKIHILRHFNVKPFKCTYEGCSWSFYTSFRLKRHLETHLKKKEHKCNNCNSTFTTIYNLSTHLKLHERPANMSCTVQGCDKAFQTKRQMEIHLKEHGIEHAPYVCDVASCNKRYYSMNALHSHVRTHQHSIGDLRCEFCSKEFDKPCRLIAHIRSHTGVKPYVCNYEGCNWAFTSSSKLHRHQTKHTQERKFFCNVCQKAFLRSEHLKDHQLTHYVTKSFVCPVKECGIYFSAKSSLYVHMKKHRTMTENTGQPVEKNRNNSKKSQLALDVENCHNKINLFVVNPLDLWPNQGAEVLTVGGSSIENGDNHVEFQSFVREEVLPMDTGGLLNDQTMTHIIVSGDAQDTSINVPSVTASVDLLRENTTSIPHREVGCARTCLTYQDLLLKRKTIKRKTKQSPINNQKAIVNVASTNTRKPDLSDVQVTSDIVLTASLLGASQENLTCLQMLQDDPPGSTEWYGSSAEDGSIGISGSVGECHRVLLLEEGIPLAIQTSDFEQSTINLRDLE